MSFRIGIVVHTGLSWHWAPGFRVSLKQKFDIGWAEAAALELGLHMALHLGIITKGMAGSPVYLVCSDNAGIVAVANKGRSHSLQTNTILKHIYHLQADNGIRLHTVFVPSRENCNSLSPYSLASAFSRQTHSIVPPASPTPHDAPSYLCPQYKAAERLFTSRGPNSPPPTTIDHPVIHHLANVATRASLRDTASYGAAL
ncbi:hypothetical protein DFJ58DRAFT_726609 [Suillus subalutaceus]|uniref:uncharacterized protein n=1 Tax=Suillus subalutaceus TaxID=48586 RepID=UPI001B88617D|nr:uncharacterized protein DFJ58DRAFT_726609 [Suillus subalutaceus]KAG1858354.1 hypothetical protein DFJ58DRAFT_726609 [Suillus subalutaceus]